MGLASVENKVQLVRRNPEVLAVSAEAFVLDFPAT
jgi:hypothetical protein